MSDVLSALALGVSIIFGIREILLQRRVAALETQRQRDEEQARLVADVRVVLLQGDRSSLLRVTNHGPARAEAITAKIWPRANPERASSLLSDDEMPISALAPGDSYDFSVPLALGDLPPYLFELTFSDGRRPQQVSGQLPSRKV